jgi:hypothetical protein
VKTAQGQIPRDTASGHTPADDDDVRHASGPGRSLIPP